MHFYTYKITNLKNGKIYVGVHKTPDLNDDYMGSGKFLKRAINKHGIENFKKEILMFHESEYEMFEIEELIVDQHFVDRKDTYNLKLGGNGGWDLVNKVLPKEKRIEFGKIGGLTLNSKRLKNKNFDNKCRKNISVGLENAWKSGKFDGKMDHLKTCWLGKTRKQSSIEKAKETFSKIKHQQGENNNQYGTMWIYSIDEQKSIRINKNDPIPDGWKKGRKMFK